MLTTRIMVITPADGHDDDDDDDATAAKGEKTEISGATNKEAKKKKKLEIVLGLSLFVGSSKFHWPAMRSQL